MNHIYQVIKHYEDGTQRVIFQTTNKHEAYSYCDEANYWNVGFTYSYYDVDC